MSITFKSNKKSFFSRARQSDIPITCVIDVGVERETRELIEAFPDLEHFLFEPVSLYSDEIAKNYRKINHTLFPIALSDATASMHCIVRALRKDGRPTHARLSLQSAPVDGRDIVSCTRVEVSRFDEIQEVSRLDNFLFKLDVDGTELNVLTGMGSRLSKASVIIVEATFANLVERAEFIGSRDFTLVDIVDVVYYGSALYQCDLVFVRSDLVTETFSPPIGSFNPDFWTPANIK